LKCIESKLGSLLRAFRGWRRTSWQALRSRNWLTQRWRHKGAMAAKQALQHLRAVVQHRSSRERYFCWTLGQSAPWVMLQETEVGVLAH